MPTEKKVLSDPNTVSALASAASIASQGDNTPLQIALAQLIARLDRRAAREDEEEANKQELKRRAREEHARSREKERLGREAKQAGCTHRKENGRTHVICQRDHQHNFLWLCQECQKLWINDEIDHSLKTPSHMIGGPTI